MPFKSKKQELWMKINKPGMWKEWVKEYGHYPQKKRKSRKKSRKTKR